VGLLGNLRMSFRERAFIHSRRIQGSSDKNSFSVNQVENSEKNEKSENPGIQIFENVNIHFTWMNQNI
jgi:hypothetical protein